MKLLSCRLAMLSALLFFFQLTAITQPAYSFKQGVLVSGIDLQTGARYRFSNVKTGIDAWVTVTSQTGGTRLKALDQNNEGFDEAFQPSISISKNSEGYVEFQVDFTDAATGSVQVQPVVPVTCINGDGDESGNGVFMGRDLVQFFPGYYDYSVAGGKLEVTLPGSWVSINNSSYSRHLVIDTTEKDVMATIVNNNVSRFLIRIGATNHSATDPEIRNGCVYFKSFSYGHMTTLPNRTMLRLSGEKKQMAVELRGTLSASHSYDKMIIERASSQNIFGSIEKIDIAGKASAEYDFRYLDSNPENGVNYYRIRLIGTQINIQEISNTLMVKMGNTQEQFAIVNSVLQGGTPVITISSPADDEADLQVVDFSGRLIQHTKVKLNSGFNNIALQSFNTATGFFVLFIKTRDGVISKKIYVQ